MAKQEDGRNGKLAFSQPRPAEPHTKEFSAAFVSLPCCALGFPGIRICNCRCGGTAPEVATERWVSSPSLSLPCFLRSSLAALRRAPAEPRFITWSVLGVHLALRCPGGQHLPPSPCPGGLERCGRPWVLRVGQDEPRGPQCWPGLREPLPSLILLPDLLLQFWSFCR